MPIKKIAFLGLGVMGFPMAGHLANSGYHVTVYNRSENKTIEWLKHFSGSHAASVKQAVKEADIVLACVGNDDDLRQICIGEEGAFESMKAGSIFIDHTTTSAAIAREMQQQAAHSNLHFIDAPVSGGQSGAQSGVLTIMCGGDASNFNLIKPVLSHYAQKLSLMGPTGSGQLTKMVNQICIAGLVQALSEGVAFAQNAGLDAKQVFDVIGKGAAQSWQMDNRHQTMIDNEFDFGFSVRWMRKDLAHCTAEAERNGSKLPITQLVDQFYEQIEMAGGENLDTSSLVTRLPRKGELS